MTFIQDKAIKLGLSAVLLWSTVATAFKLALAELTPEQMLLIASVVSVLALSVICYIQGTLSQVMSSFKARPGYFLMLAAINPFFYYLVLFKAYDLLPASIAQPLNYSWAITLTLMASVFLGQKIRRQDWWACALGYAGVVIIATKGQLFNLDIEQPFGVVLALLSTLLWAGYWILNTKNKDNAVVSVLISFILAVPFIGLLVYWQGDSWQGSVTSISAAIYIGLFEMGITFVLWLAALKATDNTAKVSNLIFLSPFLSLILLATIIGEEIHISTVVGLILIVTGLIVQQLKKSASSKL